MNIEQLGPILGPILLIMATMASCVLVALRLLDKKTEKKNGKDKPGQAPTCELNKTAITELKVTGKFVAKEIAEINTSLSRIWEYVRNGRT